MPDPVIMVLGVVALILVVVVSEVLAAVLPVLIVITMVPPEDRAGLAALIAAADSSRRLRVWPALRVAVLARRVQRANRRPADRQPHPAGEDSQR